jgi:hypothetical protein
MHPGDDTLEAELIAIRDVQLHELRTCLVRGHQKLPMVEALIDLGEDGRRNSRKGPVGDSELG